ncbi:synaptotagmin-3-like [Rutidosis leptorrhynchoides]|uniref:synaptotagmin-3-like n=1 Tax=Rutidosis leptorrhynchoides TaxID=125765 RepID=UPI003A99A94F
MVGPTLANWSDKFFNSWHLIRSQACAAVVPGLRTVVRRLGEINPDSLIDILLELPDYERVDWLNDVFRDMWPYLDKAICGMIRSMSKPIFDEYIGVYYIRSIDFENLTLGTLPPSIQGIKVHEQNKNHLVCDLVAKWAGNPNVTLVLNVLYLPIKIQLIDIQITAAMRVTLKPNVVVSLLENPDVDFGLKVVGGNLMAIPGLSHFVQNSIKKQIARLYLWPHALEIPVLDASIGQFLSLRRSLVNKLGLLTVTVIGAKGVEGKHHTNPCALVIFKGETRKTKLLKKTWDPTWNEEFQFMLDEAPLEEIIHIEVISKKKHKFGFGSSKIECVYKNHAVKDSVLSSNVTGSVNTNERTFKIRGPLEKILNIDEASSLEVPFTLSEIHDAIRNCGGEKAPGPDGFNMKFFATHWDVVKEDLLAVFTRFWDVGEISKGCNSSFAALIPKKNDPLGFGDYRPISLIGCLYKILSKVLTKRLQRVISSVIDFEQSAYIKNRYILDGVLIANEVLHDVKVNKR